MRLLFVLLAVTLGVAYFGELALMLVLPQFLPADAGNLTGALLNASLLSLLLFSITLPLMLHYRQRNLRVARRALRLQHTLDQHAIVSITDVTGRITFANDRFCEISGYARDELLGQNHRLLKSGEHPPELYAEMWRTITQGRTWHGEVCNRNKAGGHYWVNATITPFQNDRGKPEEYVAIRTEITVQKMLEKAARQREIWLRTVLDNLGEGVYTLDAQGRLSYLNAEAQRLIGWRFEELAGRELHDIIHHHSADGRVLPAEQCPVDLALRDNHSYCSHDEVFYHKNGTAFPVAMTGAPLVMDGERQGSVAVFSDMREERLLQKRLLEAKNTAEEATRLKADFLSTMSHEIRTPLNGVIGMTDLLLDTALDNEQTEFARIIKMSADALLAIINDILDFSKIEAGRLLLEHTEFSLRQVVESSIDLLAAKANEKSLTLASFISPALSDQLIGDPTRIRQILLNFLSNAIKFTSSGEVLASASLDSSAPGEAGPRRQMVRIAVKDSGIGLSEAARAHLFQPFSQADSSTTRKYGGTGLGLSICKRLVHAMGGEIGADSVPGEGSSFWVRIPLEVDTRIAAHMPPEAPLRGKRVLVADDSAGGRTLWRSYFESWQMHVEAVDSFTGLSQRLADMARAGASPDLLLLVESLSGPPLREVVADLPAQHRRSLICCLAKPDRQLSLELAALGVMVMHQPMKQSTLFDQLLKALRLMPDAPANGSSDPVGREQAHQVAARRQLLLAEDNPINQRVAVHVLSKLGYAVDVVDNGALAVAAVARGDYALVLMDCQMPEMDGFEATAAIRRAEMNSRRHVPIVAMTANAFQGDRERCLAAGMDDYLAKPVDAARLKALLATWLPEPAPLAQPMPLPAMTGQSAVAEADPPAIDLQRLSDLFGDDLAVIDELLTLFQQSLAPLSERLQREVRERSRNLQSLAHELRGSASNVGALPLAELARKLESSAPAGDWAEIEQLAGRIDQELLRSSDFINQYQVRLIA